MPVYCGFELDVLQSLVKYFQGLSDPLISVKLYDLHKAVHSKTLNDAMSYMTMCDVFVCTNNYSAGTCTVQCIQYSLKAFSVTKMPVQSV